MLQKVIISLTVLSPHVDLWIRNPKPPVPQSGSSLQLHADWGRRGFDPSHVQTQTLCEAAARDLEWRSFQTKNTKGLRPRPEAVKVFLAWQQTMVTLPSQDTWLIKNPDTKSHGLDCAMEGLSWRIQTNFASLSHILAPGRSLHPIPVFRNTCIPWLVKILMPHV